MFRMPVLILLSIFISKSKVDDNLRLVREPNINLVFSQYFPLTYDTIFRVVSLVPIK